MFDERTVRRWLSGHSRCPQRAHRLALERILGLSGAQLGFVSPMCADTTAFPGHAAEPANVFGVRDGADIVAVSPAAGGSDVERREFLAATGAVLGLLSLSDAPSASAAPLARTGTVRVGAGDVVRVRAMTTALGNAAAELGGGVARTAAARYLTDEASPLLDGTYTDTTGRELHAAVGELAHLIAWMAQDEGASGLAQRYFARAHRLGDLGADRELASTALRGMAVQAIDAGHRATAVRLAEECVRHAQPLADPRAHAYYETTLAQAAALDQDRATIVSGSSDGFRGPLGIARRARGGAASGDLSGESPHGALADRLRCFACSSSTADK
ncbi:hypothetical protein [Embleya sp. NPDC020630]|uniref:hypothetical protein n=1 Tax=Embleya sp. NPDC020630 TaxID=3363979 RepID=UPI00379F5F04